MAQSGDAVTPDGTPRVPMLPQETRAMLRGGDGGLSGFRHGIDQAPDAGGSNPPLRSGSNGIREIRGVSGNLYRNGRSGGFGALQAPATMNATAQQQWRSPILLNLYFP